jgi:predicted PurR-regulated permease PerM
VKRGAATGVLPLALKGVRELYSVVAAIFLAAGFSFFFLWEGPDVRRWVARHLTLPEDVGLEITASLVHTTRRYVAGLSAIGASQAVIVGATAAIAGVSAWPVIAFVIFLGNYIPYVGGLIAGVFAVVLALGDQGPTAALVVLIAIVIAYFAGSHLGVFFIGGAIDLPVTAVFVLTMTGAAAAGIFGAAATAPLARLVIDARAIIRKHTEAAADEAGLGAGSGVDAGAAPPG